MFTKQLPSDVDTVRVWSWEQYEPFFSELEQAPLTEATLEDWLSRWTALMCLIVELESSLQIATSVNTADKEADADLERFLDEIFPGTREAEQRLIKRFLESGLGFPEFEIPRKKMEADDRIFCQENIPLIAQERKLVNQYDKLVGDQAVTWEDEELTLIQLRTKMLHAPRETSEKQWRAMANRWLQDRESFNALWGKLLGLRRKLAANAGFPDYRSYRWLERYRFDYSPENSKAFQQAILEAVVPAASQIYAQHAAAAGVESMRPWDLDEDLYPVQLPLLKPFSSVSEMEEKAAGMFNRIDPVLGGYFERMRRENLLDLDNRKNKAPGGYTEMLMNRRLPFVFMNATGLHDNIDTLHHEAGHAFHVFEVAGLPYYQQMDVPLEFAEVASMSMELIAMDYYGADRGGYYSQEDARRAFREHLEKIVVFWPYMAVVDAFQHWVYEHEERAMDAEACDGVWLGLVQKYIPGVNWDGLQDSAETGWHRKLHIFAAPFYYIEYGLAQMGAVQLWRNSLQDPVKALQQYRSSLALGGTAGLPDLYAAAGVKLAFDRETMAELVKFVQSRMD
ncbi:MAG: M3 family oligoendopeptidase [Anaerolineales bacterium]|nr:M3 family oligoendopeptidase [Anaerolineales bacterium]